MGQGQRRVLEASGTRCVWGRGRNSGVAQAGSEPTVALKKQGSP